MPRKSCRKDVAHEPKAFTSQVTSQWSWAYCTGDEEDPELREMYGPNAGWVAKLSHGFFEKLVRYNIVNEFNCKAASTCSRCDDRRGIYTPTMRKHGRTSKLDFVLEHDVYMHNKIKLCSTGLL